MSSKNKVELGIEVNVPALKEGFSAGLKLAQKFVKQFPPRSQSPTLRMHKRNR